MMFFVIALLIILVFQWVKADPVPGGSPIITGARGAGKTRFAVLRIVTKYRARRFWWKFRNVPLIGWLKAPKYEPKVYSNIPLRLTRKVWADVLKREHILMTEDLPKGATVFIDEIGVMVNQYSHGDPNIISDHYIDRFHCAEIFTRFYRHFVGENEGDFICTDQAVGDVNIQFRRRFDKALQLQGFHRFFGLPFYKVYVDILDISEGEVQNTKNVNHVRGESQHYFFGFLPYRLPFIGFLNYATYCYSFAYRQKRFIGTVPFDNWAENPDGLYTNYIIELRSSDSEQAAYNTRKKLIAKGIVPDTDVSEVSASELSADQISVDQAPDLPGHPPESETEQPKKKSLGLSIFQLAREVVEAGFSRPAGRKGSANGQ